MASATDFQTLVENTEFKQLLAQILAAIAAGNEDGPADARVAGDALLLAAAMIFDADPAYKGIEGMERARKQMMADTGAMLDFVRDTSIRHGMSLLHVMSQRPTLN